MNALVLLRALMKRGTARGSGGASYTSAYRLEALDPRHIARYRAALGFGADTLPVTYYYLVTQRAHLATLLDQRFPFAIAGMVHVENDLVEHMPAAYHAALDIATTVQVEAPTESGARYCLLETVAEQDGKTIFSCRSRYLARRGQRRAGTPASNHDRRDDAVIGTWKLGPGTGREYAAVSGDWNPIHLWGWSARLMGFGAPIIHGMHTVAKACAAVEAHTGDRIRAVCARFTSPIPLGETAAIALSSDGSAFSVACRDRIAVEGTLGYAPADSFRSKQ